MKAINQLEPTKKRTNQNGDSDWGGAINKAAAATTTAIPDRSFLYSAATGIMKKTLQSILEFFI